MRFLRKNTAVIVTVGPFLDKTDGVTLKTALTITNEKITLTADTDDGSAPTNILDNVTGATSGTANDLNYISGNDAAMMQLELAAADTNRLGRMFLIITDATNHCPVFHEFMVVNSALYDTFFATSGGAIPNVAAEAAGGLYTRGTGAGQINQPANGMVDVNVVNETGTALTTAGAQALRGIVDQGTAQAATGTTLQLRAAAAFADSELVGSMVLITGGTTGVGQVREITAYVGSTDTATVDTWTTTPTGTITYKIFAGPPAPVTPPNVNVSTIAANAITAAATAADFTTEVTAGLSTLTQANIRTAVGLASANLDTQLTAIDDFIDTEVAAIKAKTDNLPASPAAAGDAMALTSAERNAVADALLDRNMGTGTDSGSPTVRTMRQALRFLRNKWSISGTTLTVTKEDDATASWTSTVTAAPGADPISGNDPA